MIIHHQAFANYCFIICRVISCHFSHCEVLKVVWADMGFSSYLSRGMGTGAESPSRPLRPSGADFISSIQR